MRDKLDPQPFREWVEEELRVTGESRSALSRRLGISPSALHEWRNDLAQLPAQRVEDALHRAGVGLWEVYPDVAADEALRRGWCPACREEVATDAERRCLWCETETRQRRPRRATSASRRLSDEQLRVLHAIHIRREVAIAELGRLIWEQKGYATPKSAAQAIGRGFRRLGLEARSREQANILSRRKRRDPDNPGTADMAAYKRYRREKVEGRNRPCKGTVVEKSRKGEPCPKYAAAGSDYCREHDEARRGEVLAQLEDARRRYREMTGRELAAA